MAEVNAVIGPAGVRGADGGIDVYDGRFRLAETISSSDASTAFTIRATRRDAMRIKVSGGSIYVSAAGPDPEAVAGEGWLLGDGDILDLGNLRDGDTVAVVDAVA